MQIQPEIPSEDTSDHIQTLQSIQPQLILSCSISNNRKLILITTQFGFLIVSPNKPTQYQRYQNKQSPFFINQQQQCINQYQQCTNQYQQCTNQQQQCINQQQRCINQLQQCINQQQQCGIRLGFIFQEKPQVAIVPAFCSKKYKQTSIYIFNYSARVMLGCFDMVLPIKQFKMTDKYILCSNNKRILVYNYLKCAIEDDERFYIRMHEQGENLDWLRYIDLNCHLANSQNHAYCRCECGKFQLGSQMKIYMKLFFVRIEQQKSYFIKQLYIYDEITEKVRPFEQVRTLSDNFTFSVSQNGKYMLIAEDYNRKIKVFNVQENCNFIALLHLSRSPGDIINLGVITDPLKGEYVVASRERGGDEATMHLFQLRSGSLIQAQESKYKRYFRLYKKESIGKKVFGGEVQFIGPQYYMLDGRLMCLAMEGEQCELIDLNRTGLHERASAGSYLRIQEQK